MALNIGELVVQISANTDALKAATPAFSSVEKAVNKLAANIEKLDATINKVSSSMTGKYTKAASVARKSNSGIAMSAKRAALEQKKLAAETEIVGNAFVNAGVKAKGASHRLSGVTSKSRNLGLGVQNASYQLQDMVVQFQMGTDTARIMGQQLPQLFSGFGVLGSVIGLAAAGLFTFIPMMMSAGDESKKSSEKIDAQKRSLEHLASVTDSASEAFARFRGKSRDFQIKDLKQQADEARRALEDAINPRSDVYPYKPTNQPTGDIQKLKQQSIEATAAYERAQVELNAETEYTIRGNIELEKQLNTLFDAYKAGTLALKQYEIEQEVVQEIDRQGLRGKEALIKLLREEITLRHYRDKSKTKDNGEKEISNLQLQYQRAITTLEDVRMKGSSIYESVNKAFGSIKIVKDFEDSLRNVEEAQLSVKAGLLGINFSPMDDHATKVKKVAQAMGDLAIKTRDADDETKKLMASSDAIMSVLNQLISGFASVAGQLTSMYQAQASYHQQMAMEALNYGRSQSELYMQLADSVHYSNNQIAQSYEQRAMAAAESSAKQYQEEQKAREKSNAMAKAMFENQKKLQIAQAIMSTATAVMDTYKNSGLGIYAAPLAAAMGALGAAQVAMISSQKFTPRESGGPVIAGRGYVTSEAGPEIFVPGRSGTIISQKEIMSGLAGGGSSQGGDTIIFQVTANDTRGFDELLQSRRGLLMNMIRQAKNDRMGTSA